MTENDLYPESEAPFKKPEEMINQEDSMMFYSYLLWNEEKDRYDIMGFAQVEFYTDGSAEVVTVQPPEFEKFLEEQVYGVENPHLQLVSSYHKFNEMLAEHWKKLPVMWQFNLYSGFIETDEEGLDKMIVKYGWLPDEKPEENKEE
jgi:hypothetical protein